MTDKPEKTKLQRAIDYIFAHPGCRSDKLGELLDISPNNVLAYVRDAIQGGLIVTCKVERPGKPSLIEFKPSAQAPEKAPDWKEWKKAHVAPTPEKPLVFKADGPRAKNVGSVSETPAGGGEHITGSRESESPVGAASTSAEVAAVVETQAADVMAAEGTAPTVSDPAASDVMDGDGEGFYKVPLGRPYKSRDANPDIHISLDNAGQLTIDELRFSAAETRAIGEFLVATSSAWV